VILPNETSPCYRLLLGAPLLALLALSGCSDEPAASPAAQEERDASGLPAVDVTTPLPDPLPQVAALVDGHEIPTRNVVILAEERIRRGQVLVADRIAGYRMGLQELIAREILFQEAVRRGLGPDETALEQLYDDARSGHRDDTGWNEFLAQQGMDEQTFRQELRLQQTVNALVAQLLEGGSFEVPDEDVRAFYDANPDQFQTGEQLRASHIQLRLGKGVDETESISQLAEIRAQIVDGADFAALAKKHSADAGSAGRGGELAPFTRAQMPKEFADAAFALEPGELSEVVKTPHGVHIIELHERIPSQLAPFESIKEPLRQQLLGRRRQQYLQDRVAELRAAVRIETFL
jgi:hypothetical protein